MVKLLVIADDFTGALDTGVQFAASGAETRVVTNIEYDFSRTGREVQVLVLVSETRHVKWEEAYRMVYGIAKRACESGIPYLYKKTDSALRGNIGSELKAVLDAAGKHTLHFLPAFPRMNRVTRNGIHYIDGSPVHESVFGKDPFEPVTCSYIPDMMRGEVPVTVVESMDGWERQNGVMVYDASTDEELMSIGSFLKEKGELGLTAGCAGFAAVLPQLLGLSGKRRERISLDKKLLVACGSVNPITVRQLDYAERAGMKRIRLTPEQKLEKDYLESEEGNRALEEWTKTALEEECCIFDTNDLPGCRAACEYAGSHGLSLDELRVRIADTLGRVVEHLVRAGVKSTMLLTGGDTLMGFMRHIGCDEIVPACEMAPGTVLSQVDIDGRTYSIISKSGGFGEEKLIAELAEKIGGKHLE
ncbi:MAG: four-carbon acid sugar kinase family protein [Lacrimispora saccharolytica]